MIIDLPIPQTRDELNLHRVGSLGKNEGQSTSSDNSGAATIKLPILSQESLESSLCPHAVAFGSFVYGIRPSNNPTLHETDANDADAHSDEGGPWISWKRSFAPYHICRVTSNYDGSIIVCSTDAGTVALLRGIDGAVIATRKVTIEDENDTIPSPQISFVAHSPSLRKSTINDAVAIGVPSSNSSAFVLVSNIDAKSLNHNNPLQVSEAARKMTIRKSLQFPRPNHEDVVVTTCGLFMEPSRIRFFTLDLQGTIAVHDFDCSGEVPEEKALTVVNPDVSWRSKSGEQKMSSINFGTGLRIHNLHQKKRYVIFSDMDSKRNTVHFVDPTNLAQAGSFEVSSDSSDAKRKRPKLLAVEPVTSAMPESALAVAVAFQPAQDSPGGGMIHIVQALVKDDDGSLHSFHRVYAVPIDETISKFSLSMFSPGDFGFYSFRYKLYHGGEKYSCKAFAAGENNHEGSIIGKIRLLIRLGQFDEAEQLVSNCGEHRLILDTCAGFHSSEITLRRLQKILEGGSIKEKTKMLEAKQCFQKLTLGCFSGNERAGLDLLEAAELIAQWASPSASNNPPTVPEVTTALGLVAKSLDEVITRLPSEQNQVFEAKRHILEKQLITLKVLTSLAPEDSDQKAQFINRFQGSRYPAELFSNLIASEHFLAAVDMWHSHQFRLHIGTEKAVESIIRLGPDVDPGGYATVLLEKLIMPSLSINYDLLPSLWVWSCQLADELDRRGRLEQAIILLQAIERGTNALQLRVHESFSSFSPFVNRPLPRHKQVPVLPRKTTNADSSASSFISLPASPRTPGALPQPRTPLELVTSFPTVLTMGQIKRGAMKSVPVSSSIRHVKRATGTGDDTEEVREDRVREKLFNAKCLEAARCLGLSKKAADLKSFSTSGGMQIFSNELVQFLSASATNHDERCSIFAEKYKPFCERFSIDFNMSLLHYVKDLCRSTNTTSKTIQECASLAQCCDKVLMKCQGILVVLRAALYCKYSPTWLTGLSRDAVEWSAIDLGLRSELVEASRLLLIDGIARKYCGAEGCDLFRVDNPRHAVRLLEFITLHYQCEGVLDDALDLCDAFYHLSRLDATTALCAQAVSEGNVEKCTNIMERIYEKDIALGDSTCEQVVGFCAELLSENSNRLNDDLPKSQVDKLKESALHGSAAACAILSILFDKARFLAAESTTMNHYSRIDMVSLKSLKLNFTWISEMQRDHSVFLTLSDLRSTPTLLEVAASLMAPVVTAFVSGDQSMWNLKLSRARRACSLLSSACECPEMEFWCAASSTVSSPLQWAHDDGRCIEFLKHVGLLGGLKASNRVSSQTILSVAYSLCLKGSKQAMSNQSGFNENIGRAVSLINDYLLLCCPDSLLLHAQSLSTLTETVLNVLLRGDEGVGEKLEKHRLSLLFESLLSRDRGGDWKQTVDKGACTTASLCRSIHSTWYIGDGLLLPPSESMSRSVEYCKAIISSLSISSHRMPPMSCSGIHEMIHFLFHRGALSVGIRLLSCSSALLLCSRVPDSALNALTRAFQGAWVALVERSLGGIGNGITNSMVDSQLAVSALLSLPMKIAFKVYTAAVPAARSTRDFNRVISLANIGVVAGGQSSDDDKSTKKIAIGWKNQTKFVAQCQRLAEKAVWWKFLLGHHISFDHKLLDDKNLESELGSSYAQSLIVPIITKLRLQLEAKSDSSVQVILDVVGRYAATFGLQPGDVVEAYIGLLLSSTENAICLLQAERSVRTLIPLLQSRLQRALVLRRCVVALEENDKLSKEYERHALVLSIYLECLHGLRTTTQTQVQTQIFEAELEAIDRRSDALAILSSVFEGEKQGDRPAFSSFFRPLPADLSEYASGHMTTGTCNILGNSDNSPEKTFDPLQALQGVLLRSYDVNTSKALAPLCLPLGLPSGYIHARFLMEHFRWSKAQQTTLPSFTTDVLPVVRMVHSAGDKATLAKWCCSYYSCSTEDEDRLKCLELALKNAILASSEAEQRKLRYAKNKQDTTSMQALEKEEQAALDLVERLSKAKSSLADKITVVTALSSGSISSSIFHALLARLEKSLWSSPDILPDPEEVTEKLLREASLLAAEACVGVTPLSMEQFQKFCSTISSACQALSEQHSHIRIDQITSLMVRNWLFQGDGNGVTTERKPTQSKPVPHASKSNNTIIPYDFSEDDTMNIVLDLNSIQVDEVAGSWEHENASALKSRKITSDEELTSLKQSEREIYEETTVRVGLRVAFVLACHGNDRQIVPLPSDVVSHDENTSASANSRASSGSSGKGKGLLSRIEKASTKQKNYVMECASDLLKIVFARPELHCGSRFVARQEQRVVTFGMRHRALRSLAILVPQDAVERLVSDESYLGGEVSLCQCTFGAFVADECEAIGLPLIHSDLSHISSIHYSSYARTLWRHHRDGDLKGSRGRLLLLLLEMSLKGEAEVDTTFIGMILKEMRNLSRTLLLACERVLSCKGDLGSQKFDSILLACSNEMHTAAMTSASSILNEIEEKLRIHTFDSDEKATSEACSLLRRLSHVFDFISSNLVDCEKQISLNSMREKLVDFEDQLQKISDAFCRDSLCITNN